MIMHECLDLQINRFSQVASDFHALSFSHRQYAFIGFSSEGDAVTQLEYKWLHPPYEQSLVAISQNRILQNGTVITSAALQGYGAQNDRPYPSIFIVNDLEENPSPGSSRRIYDSLPNNLSHWWGMKEGDFLFLRKPRKNSERDSFFLFSLTINSNNRNLSFSFNHLDTGTREEYLVGTFVAKTNDRIKQLQHLYSDLTAEQLQRKLGKLLYGTGIFIAEVDYIAFNRTLDLRKQLSEGDVPEEPDEYTQHLLTHGENIFRVCLEFQDENPKLHRFDIKKRWSVLFSQFLLENLYGTSMEEAIYDEEKLAIEEYYRGLRIQHDEILWQFLVYIEKQSRKKRK